MSLSIKALFILTFSLLSLAHASSKPTLVCHEVGRNHPDDNDLYLEIHKAAAKKFIAKLSHDTTTSYGVKGELIPLEAWKDLTLEKDHDGNLTFYRFNFDDTFQLRLGKKKPIRAKLLTRSHVANMECE